MSKLIYQDPLNGLRGFINEVDKIGTVFSGSVDNLQDWDTIFKQLNRMNIKGGELIFYGSPKLLFMMKNMLHRVNAGDGRSYGSFKLSKESEATQFISEQAMGRGSYEIYFVCKPITGGVIIPNGDYDNLPSKSIHIHYEE